MFVGDGARIVRWAADPLRLMVGPRLAGDEGGQAKKWPGPKTPLCVVFIAKEPDVCPAGFELAGGRPPRSVDQRCIIDQRDVLVAANTLSK